MKELIECDCGHMETDHPNRDFTPGYGRNEQGLTFCWECCAEKERAFMREKGKNTLYFVKRDDGYHVTDWTGLVNFPAKNVRKSRHNLGRVRFDFWFKFEGQTWHGYQIGDFNQIAHCKRTKAH